MVACSNMNETANKNSTSIKKSSNTFDASLTYANNLCNSGKYNQAISQLKKSYSIASSNIKTSISNKQKSLVMNAYGDCYLTQGKYDTAIKNYETALQSKYPPNSSYIGITKAYLGQKNYPKSALYISSYPGNENNKEVLQLKIKALTGLLENNYEISPSNRKLLQDKLSQLQQNLAKLNNNPASKNNSSIQPINTDTKQDNNNIKTNKYLTENTSNVKSRIFKDRIKVTDKGRHYIVVNNGDTLFNIAKKANTTQERLIQINHLKNDYAALGTRMYLD